MKTLLIAAILISTLPGCAVNPYALQMMQQSLLQGQMQSNANYNWQMQQIQNNRQTRCQSYYVGNRYYTDCN